MAGNGVDGDLLPPLEPRFTPRPRGRPKGSTTKKRVATQERVNKLADPLDFWCRVSNGQPVRVSGRGKTAVMHQPTLEQVFEAKAS